MGIDYPPPLWALKTAGPGDRAEAVKAYRRGRLKTNWDPHPYAAGINYGRKPLSKGPSKAWAREQGWPTPWWSFRKAFLATLLENDENFRLGLTEGGVELYFPKREHTLSAEELQKLDDLYSERSADGRPSGWGSLVAALRDIRRAVEAGVTIKVEGKSLATWSSFYSWAHGRYHGLEDGYDSWIGDDTS